MRNSDAARKLDFEPIQKSEGEENNAGRPKLEIVKNSAKDVKDRIEEERAMREKIEQKTKEEDKKKKETIDLKGKALLKEFKDERASKKTILTDEERMENARNKVRESVAQYKTPTDKRYEVQSAFKEKPNFLSKIPKFWKRKKTEQPQEQPTEEPTPVENFSEVEERTLEVNKREEENTEKFFKKGEEAALKQEKENTETTEFVNNMTEEEVKGLSRWEKLKLLLFKKK